MYKLISTDIDGTIVPYLSSISEDMLKTIIGLLKKGVLIVPNTGRPLNALNGQLKDCHFKYYICGNGSYVYDADNKKAIYEAYMDNEMASELLDYMASFNEVAIVFMNNIFVADSNMREVIRKSEYSFMENNMKFIYDLSSRIKSGNDNIQKLVLRCDVNKKQNYLKLIKEKFPNLYYTASGDENIEITDPKAAKDIGLIKLCEYLHISLDEVIVMGDNDNDLPVLSLGCFNIVPENGNDNAKRKASVVCDACENGGPIKTIEKMYEDGLLSEY